MIVFKVLLIVALVIPLVYFAAIMHQLCHG